MSWRGQGGGKRARGRRGDQDPEPESTAWLAELERTAAEVDDEEEDWVAKLRGGRSPTPPPVPDPPPSGNPPPPVPDPVAYPSDSSWLPAAEPPATEPDSHTGPGAWEADWATRPSSTDPGWMGSSEDREGGGNVWQSPPPDPPADREPDYPALFGELYRRRADQDPLWAAPPAAEPLPEPAQPDPTGHEWPFEETTQTWEPSDRSFEWPAEELPSTSTEWEPSPSWLDDPPAQPSTGPAPGPPAPAAGNGVTQAVPHPVPPDPPPMGPPPADWADAVPTDVPAARRAQLPEARPPPHTWRPEEAVESEPAVPLGTAQRSPATAPAAAEPTVARRTQPGQGRRGRQPHDRTRSTWPRVVAVISWIVLVMVVCWFYVFPWLERILPENF